MVIMILKSPVISPVSSFIKRQEPRPISNSFKASTAFKFNSKALIKQSGGGFRPSHNQGGLPLRLAPSQRDFEFQTWVFRNKSLTV